MRRASNAGMKGRSTSLETRAAGRFFWDDRVQVLEEMVLCPIQDPVEMGLDFRELER